MSDRTDPGMRLVYGIVSARSDPQVRVSGVTGHSAFDTIAHGRVAAVTSVVREVREATPDDLRSYLGVLDDVLAATTVLPMRFGVVFDSAEAVVDELLSPNAPAFEELLSRMDALVEMRVRAVYREDAALAAILEARADLLRRQRELEALPEDATYFERIEFGRALAEAMSAMARRDGAAIEARLTDRSVDVAPGELPEGRRVTTTSYLVERRTVQPFLGEVDRIRTRYGDLLDLRAIGPMPPFSFVDLRMEPANAGGRV